MLKTRENVPSGGTKQTLGKVLTFSQSTSTSSSLAVIDLILSSVGIEIKSPEDEEGVSYCDTRLNLDKIDLGLLDLGSGNG